MHNGLISDLDLCHIYEDMFNAGAFNFDTNVVVRVTLIWLPGFVIFMDL